MLLSRASRCSIGSRSRAAGVMLEESDRPYRRCLSSRFDLGGAWEMGETIFLAVTRDSKFEIGIGQLGCAASCATMQWLFLRTPAFDKTPAPACNLLAI